MDKVSDRDLVIQLQSNRLESLGVLFDRHRNMVYRTALAITVDIEAAADLLQDVFLRLHRYATNIDPDRPLEPWLYRITINMSYDWVKSRKRLPKPLDVISEWFTSTAKNIPYDTVEKDDDIRQVYAAIASLPLSQRAVVVLYYLNDLKIQEISEILEIPVGTVKSRLHYGRISLRRYLGLTEYMLTDLTYEVP